MIQRKKVRDLYLVFVGSIVFTFYFVNQLGSQTSVYDVTQHAPAHTVATTNRSVSKGPKLTYHKPIYILWTRWRCGSSFLGRLLSVAKPNIFYAYEPLHSFGLKVMKQKDKKTKFAIKFLVDLMNCQYENYEYFVDYFMKTDFFYTYNPLTSDMCTPPVPACNSTTMLHNKCQHSSLQIMKLLRLSLAYGESFLEYNPNIKIIYLARDPRATMKSRSRLLWCLLKDCHDPKRVCELLEDDMKYSVDLMKKYPDRFMFMRYEDLALEPKQTFAEVWKFLGQQYTPEVDRMIDGHTLADEETGTYALHKNSTRNVFAWRASLDIKSLDKIQKNCGSVMQKLGYFPFTSEQQYENMSVSPLLEGPNPFVEEHLSLNVS